MRSRYRRTSESRGSLLRRSRLGSRFRSDMLCVNKVGLAAGLLELLLGRGREEVRVHRELLGERAVAEDLHEVGRAGHEALLLERVDRDLARVEAGADVAEVDGEDLLLEARVGEPALRDAARH